MNILFIDDEEDLLEIAAGFFEDENLHLDTSTNIQDALKKINSKEYDVIISDANLPSGSGRDLLKKLRHEMNFKGKLILASGDLENPSNKLEIGYDLAVTKPLDFCEIIELIKKF